MPIEFNGFGVYAPEAHLGLTKREMFAMNAPEMPNWFVTKELGTRIYQSELGKLEFKWRWHYADMMLQEGEK